MPKDSIERQRILKNIEDEANTVWNSLDTEFYKYEEDLYTLMLTYVANNIEKFR